MIDRVNQVVLPLYYLFSWNEIFCVNWVLRPFRLRPVRPDAEVKSCPKVDSEVFTENWCFQNSPKSHHRFGLLSMKIVSNNFHKSPYLVTLTTTSISSLISGGEVGGIVWPGHDEVQRSIDLMRKLFRRPQKSDLLRKILSQETACRGRPFYRNSRGGLEQNWRDDLIQFRELKRFCDGNKDMMFLNVNFY